MLRMKLKQTSIAGAVLSVLAVSGTAVAENGASYFDVSARAQLEAVNASGDLAKASGNDGFHLADGWGFSRKDVNNFSGIFLEAGHRLEAGAEIFVRAGFNFDTEGFKDGRGKYREQFIGVRGTYGQLRVGRFESPYMMSGLGYDPLNATSLQSRANYGRSSTALGHGGFIDDGIAYQTDLYGAKLDVSYSKSDGGSSQYSTYAAALSVPITDTLELTFAHIDAQNAGGGKRDGTKFGAKYQADQWTIAGQYEFRGTGLENGDYAFLSVGYQAALGKLILNYGRFTDDSVLKTDGEYLAAALQRKLNNHFAYHAGLRYLDRDNLGSETIVAIGIRASWQKRYSW